ncbi:hypothetical protein Btru_053662 [Bulinus truncatus]|nr:hypothetical protein Btru_053662 [Bulinus truncatus]
MTSRRTRSGAPLGCPAEPRRLRQTPSRKQQRQQQKQKSAQDKHPVDADVRESKTQPTHVEVLDKKHPPAEYKCATGSPEDSSSSPPPPPLNIWERMGNVQKECANVAQICPVRETEEEDQNSETLSASAKNSLPEVCKRGRKPEILLSLLEGEPLVPGCQAKVEYIDQRKEEEKEGAKSHCYTAADAHERKWASTDEHPPTFPLPQSVCFFPNCDHRHENSADFSTIPEVPGEPFFVSLSKDKNKELNMVKTSSGMVRVGCGLRQFLSPTHAASDSYASDPVSVRNKSQSQDRGSTSICPIEARVHVVRIDKGSGRRVSRSKEKLDKDAQEYSETDNRKKAGKDETYEVSQTGETKDRHVEQDFKKLPYSSDQNKDVVTTHVAVSQSSQHPIMEEILAEHHHHHHHAGYTTSSSGSVSIHEITTDDVRQSKKTISLLKPPAVTPQGGSTSTFPPATSLTTIITSASSLMSPATSSEGEYEKKNTLKRSERLRCKTGVSNLTISQSVISTMKPTDPSRSRIKPSLQKSKKKSKLAFNKDSQKKKKKTGIVCKKVGSSKKSKESSRTKVTMSREVMDAIVQSIEETVSRSREEKKSSSEQASPGGSDYGSYNDLSSSFSDSSKESSYVDHWSDTVSTYDDSGVHLTDRSVTSTSSSTASTPSSHKHSQKKAFKSKIPHASKSSSKSKKARRHSPASSKTKPIVSKKREKPPATETSPAVEPDASDASASTTEASGGENAFATGDGGAASAMTMQSKRFRKKTRKAEEALGDYDVFCDEEWPIKKSKCKKRSSSCDSSGCNSQRRPRRSSQLGGLMTDPVLEEHAFILWARLVELQSPGCAVRVFGEGWSENRSQIEVQHPGASTCQVDAMLSSRWCDVTDSVKSRFFFRAREAFSDDDRHMLRTGSMAGEEVESVTTVGEEVESVTRVGAIYTPDLDLCGERVDVEKMWMWRGKFKGTVELESCALGDYFTDNDSVRTEFIRLPIERQRELLRKWLKFFQKMLPKKEYVEFIVTFKRACGRDGIGANGKPKRTRMRCLDPAHYKMLFDMIRLAKPRILEIYKDKKLKEKKMVSDTYSLMLHKLITNDVWPHTMSGYRSELLTDVLQDLDIADGEDSVPGSASTSLSSSVVSLVSEDTLPCGELEEEVKMEESVSGGEPGRDARVHITVVNKMPQILEFKLDHGGNDVSFDEADYSLLNTDLALTLLSSVNEMKELPVLDQQTLDQIFLAPPRLSVNPSPQRRVINLYGRRVDNLATHLSPTVGGSPCSPRLLASDSAVAYSKMNLHYTTTKPSSSPCTAGHKPRPTLSLSTALPHRYAQRDSPSISPARNVCCRKDSPMDMHSYSITMESMMHPQGHMDSPMPKCIKVDPASLPSQTKVSLQSLQLPVTSRVHQQSKLHPRVVPVSCGGLQQQRFTSQAFTSSGTGAAVLDKLGSHHVCHVTSSTPAGARSSSRLYPQAMGALTAQSPLITSLSPLRNIKYSQYSQSTQVYGPHCQVMPYRPRMQVSAGVTGGAPSRRNSHAVPLGTTMKTGVARAPSNLQQIKVCLPTQSLKIPIAKLRGSRKASSYVKGKLKNMGLSSGTFEPYSTMTSCSQPTQFNVRSGTPTSLLAKVLNLQVKNESDFTSGMSVDGIPCALSRSATPSFIGTMRPVGSQSGYRSSSQVQLISVVTSSGHSGDLRSALSPQTAVVVSPLSVNRNSVVSSSSDLSSTTSTYSSATSLTTSQFIDFPIQSASVQAKGNRSSLGKGLSPLGASKTFERNSAHTLTSKRNADSASHQVSGSDDEAGVEFIVVGTCTTEVESSALKHTPLSKQSSADRLVSDKRVTTADPDVSNKMKTSLDRTEPDSDSNVVDSHRALSQAASVQDDDVSQPLTSDNQGATMGNNPHDAIVQGTQHDLSSGTWRKMTALEDDSPAPASAGSEPSAGPGVKVDVQGVASQSSADADKYSEGIQVEVIQDPKDPSGSSSACTTSADKDGACDVQIVSESTGGSKSLLGSKIVIRSFGEPKLTKGDPASSRKSEAGDPGSKLKKMTMCSVTVQPATGCILVENLGVRDKPGPHARCPAGPSAGAVVSPSAPDATLTPTKEISLKPAPLRENQSANQGPHTSPTTQSGCPSRKRAHYVHEYLPT